jgi:hypothetical protein
MVNEKEALYCREALEALGFKVFYSGGGHYHHVKEFTDHQVMLNGLNDIDDVGKLVTDRKSTVFATFEAQSEDLMDSYPSETTSLMFHSLADAISFFSTYEIKQKDKVGEAIALMERHGFEYTSTGGGCDAFALDVGEKSTLFLVSNAPDGMDTYPQWIDEPVQLSLDVDCEQVCYWWFDDLTSALAFADVFVSKKGE